MLGLWPGLVRLPAAWRPGGLYRRAALRADDFRGNPRRTANALHLAGPGDRITIATSTGSHHHELGRRLVRGETAALQGEGVHTLKMVHAHRLFDPGRYPLFDLVGRLLAIPATVSVPMKNFLEQMNRA